MRRLPVYLALLLAQAGPASAATYCAATATEFQNALGSAAASIDFDEVRLVRGTYSQGGPFTYGSNNRGWIFVSGGWDPGCLGRSLDATTTVLDGNGQHQVLQMSYLVQGAADFGPRIGVENLTVRNGVGPGFTRGGGIALASYANGNAQAELWLENVIVRNCSGYFGGGADLYANRGLVRVSNSLFEGNSAPTSAFGHLAVTINATEASNGTGAIIINSTFVNGTCASQGGRGCGIGLQVPTGMRADVLNSAFFNNVTSDVNAENGLTSGGIVAIDSSLVGAITGNLPPTITRPVGGPPGFIDAAGGNFRLRDDSPLLNKGLGFPPYYTWQNFDLDGAQRVRSGVLDVGAYENQPFVFGDGFESQAN